MKPSIDARPAGPNLYFSRKIASFLTFALS
jgi:hypothetical protein